MTAGATTGPRLVLVTRRFWPLVGGAERQMASLAAELRKLGAEVTILTAHWDVRWPAEISHHGVRVVRLPNPSLRGWGTVRYMLAIGRWLQTHRDSYDLVYVSSLRHDAYAAICARDLGVGTGMNASGPAPVVLRAEGVGQTGDVHWQHTATFGGRISRRCQKAEAIVVQNSVVDEELRTAGYQRLKRINNGVALPAAARTEEQRATARADLSYANAELTVAAGAPVAVYTGKLHETKGLDALLAAWKLVIEQQPRARLWLVGDGPAAPHLANRIERLGLRRRVQLAGTFDDVDQFLKAADLFVLPSSEEGTSLALLEAMAVGLPVVVSDIASCRHVLGNEADGDDSPDKDTEPETAESLESLLVESGNADSLAAAVLHIFDSPETAARWGQAARHRVGEAFSIAKMAEQHLQLFERLISEQH